MMRGVREIQLSTGKLRRLRLEPRHVVFNARGVDDQKIGVGREAVGVKVVYHAAALPGDALRHGAVVVEINPQPTPLTDRADFVLTGSAGTLLPALLRALGK